MMIGICHRQQQQQHPLVLLRFVLLTILVTITRIPLIDAWSTTSTTTTSTRWLLYQQQHNFSPPFNVIEQQQQQQQQRWSRMYSKTNTNNDNDDTDDTTTTAAAAAVVVAVVERPDPSILLSSQSDTIQQIGIFSIMTALLFGTYVCIQLFAVLQYQILPNGWYELWRDYTWPIPLGIIFIAAGISHFILKETYIAMVPPKNTWGGLWQIPTPYIHQIRQRLSTITTTTTTGDSQQQQQQLLSYEEYHVYWSGIAEIGGGLLLIASFVYPMMIPIYIPSFLLLLLLICITPANIYMATHDIQPPNLPPIPYPMGHIGRGILQCLLIAMLYQLTFQ